MVIRNPNLTQALAPLLTALLWLALTNPATAASGCTTLYDPGNGWLIEQCASDPNIAAPMDVALDGVAQGQAALVRISHQSQHNPGAPQVAVIYASGFIRLKQNADPTPAVPFGSSFILGPAYWPNAATYHHNPQLTRLEIDTGWLPSGPLRMRATGRNQAFDISYDLTMPPPRDRQTRLHVSQRYTATTALAIDATRRAEAQGFKLVQISSMYISEGGACAGGLTDCHDSNVARFIDANLVRRQVPFSTVTPSSFIFTTTTPLGSTWLDALHTDDQSWQGNTPNVRIALDALPSDRTITPQGWLNATTDPNDDNVSLWLHDDGLASQSWSAGQSAGLGYWLLAQDDPPEPWADLGLRPGQNFLDFETSYNCFLVKDSSQSTGGAVREIAGYAGTALELLYDLGSANANWVQLRCDFNPPLDLSASDQLRFDWRGDPAAANSIEVALLNPGSGQDNIFGRGYHHPTHHSWWGQLVVPFNHLHPWTAGASFDPGQVSGFFISVVKDPTDDTGGAGSLAVDNLSAYNIVSRTVPAAFEPVGSNITAATAAANWLVSRQTGSGLLKSWEETSCKAWLYDQALALIVLAHEKRWTEARLLLDTLASLQESDGAWLEGYDCNSLAGLNSNRWEGSIAWLVYALNRYLAEGGSHPQAAAMRDRGAAWLAGRIDPVDGCLVIDHTEGTIDAWWALQASSRITEANGLKQCLLTQYWDESIGRFKGGKDWQQPYLDNQTWGAAFLAAIGQDDKARRALSYAWETLRLPAQGGQLYGLDGQGGPWSVWNEGSAQHVAAGGPGANDLLQELLAQQRSDGALPGSPDEFSGGGVWTTRMAGVAPTAWLYFALCGEPFHPPDSSGCRQTWLPLLLK